jgi:hypothetical protein
VNTRLKLAFWCYLLAMAGPAVFGIVFLTRNEFMPYHADAVGMRWTEVPRPFQVLILALLKLAGGAWLTVAVAEFILLLGPFRQGVRWALWAVPSLGLLHYAGVAIAMTHVTLNTPASPPWIATIASSVVILAAAAISLTCSPKSARA